MALSEATVTGLVEAARRVGCSVAQLRWLEKRRVIVRPRRDYAGRRVYSEAELREIAGILLTKDALRGEPSPIRPRSPAGVTE